jgi:AcrR family transcriptional regulator
MDIEEEPAPRWQLQLEGQLPPERADAARNRQRILNAARALMNETGADRLTMNVIAARAGVGVGTVYRRFGDQAGLVDALMNDREAVLQHQMIAGPPPLGPGADPVERIRAFLHNYADLLEEYAPLLATVAIDRRLRHRSQGAHAVHRQHLAILIGQVSPALDATYLAEAFLASLEGPRFLAQRREQGFELDRIKAGLDQLVAGLTAAELPDR